MNPQRHWIRLADGSTRLLDDQEELPPNAKYLSPLGLRDAATLRDAALSDADRADAARLEMIADLSTAWMRPSQSWQTPPPHFAGSTRDTADNPEAAHRQMVADLESAWKHPHGA